MSWLPKKTVVVPIDLSAASAAAVETALQLVAQPQDVHVLHVLHAALSAPVMIYGEVMAVGELTSRLASASTTAWFFAPIIDCTRLPCLPARS